MKRKSLVYGAIGFVLGSIFGLLFFGVDFLIIGIAIALISAGIGYRADVHSDVLNRISAVRSKMKSAQSDKGKIIASRQIIEQWLKEKAPPQTEVSKEAVDAVFWIVSAYVDRTPNVMEALFHSCKWSNLEKEIIYLLRETCLAYFEAEDDLLPDSVGISGYLDDAFATQYLIEKVAGWQGTNLRNSIEGSVDLHAANAFIAGLLPNNVVETLKNKVDIALNKSQMRQMVARIALQSAALQGNWSRASNRVDFNKEIIKDEIYSDLAKDGIYMRPTM